MVSRAHNVGNTVISHIPISIADQNSGRLVLHGFVRTFDLELQLLFLSNSIPQITQSSLLFYHLPFFLTLPGALLFKFLSSLKSGFMCGRYIFLSCIIVSIGFAIQRM
ncbi:hypothetical protein M5689_023517 [Euphorbia peplus]|nr:hypothetical protein M5689_023517 [Euphorbia peplus]